MAVVSPRVIYNIAPEYTHATTKKKQKKNLFTNLVSTFVPQSEGSFLIFYGAWEASPGRGSLRGRWLSVLCQWNGGGALIRQTTESRDAYRPLRGCLTAGVAAGHVPPRLHTYRTHFYSLAHLFIFYYCDYFTVTCSDLGLAAGRGGSVFPPYIPFLLLLLILFPVSD